MDHGKKTKKSTIITTSYSSSHDKYKTSTTRKQKSSSNNKDPLGASSAFSTHLPVSAAAAGGDADADADADDSLNEKNNTGWQMDPSFSLPTDFRLIKTMNQQWGETYDTKQWNLKDLLYSPVGSLTANQIKMLLEAYKRGGQWAEYELADLPFQLHRRKYDFQRWLPVGRRLVSIDHYNNNGVAGSDNDFFDKQMQPRRGSFSLDWVYLTDLCLEGWVLLSRITAELGYQKHQQKQYKDEEIVVDKDEENGATLLAIPILSPWVLQLWRRIYQYEFPARGPCQERLPPPGAIYPLVQTCLDLETWIWFPDMVTTILDVVQHICQADPSQKQPGAFLAQTVFDALVTDPVTLSPLIVVDAEASPQQEQEQKHSRHSSRPRYPHRNLITKMAGIWYQSGHVEAPHQAMRLLQILVRLHEMHPWVEQYHPDTHVFAAVIACWARRPHVTQYAYHQHNQHRIVSLLDQRHHYNDSTNKSHDWHSVAQQIAAVAGTIGLSLFKEAREKYHVALTPVLYDAVFKCLNRSHDPFSQQQVSSLLDERLVDWIKAVRRAKYGHNLAKAQRSERYAERMQIKNETYHPLIESYCRTGQTHQAIQLIARMEALAKEFEEPAFLPSCHDIIESTLIRKVQAHGSQHDRYPFLQWGKNSKDNTISSLSSLAYEREALETWEKISNDLTKTLDDKEPLDLSMAVRDAFSFFDELTVESVRSESRISPFSQLFPLPCSALNLAVRAWKQMANERNDDSSMTSSDQNDQRWGPQCRRPETHPRWLLNRLNNYCAVGLFRPSGETLEFMLDLVETCAPDEHGFTAHILTDALVGFLAWRSGGNPEADNFPDAQAWCRVMENWHTFALRQEEKVPGHKRLELKAMTRIIRNLKHWYKATGDVKFRPTAHMYALLVDAWIHAFGHAAPESLARKALKAFAEYQELWNDSDTTIEESMGKGRLYEAVVRAGCKALSPNQAMELFDEVIEKCRNKSTVLPMDRRFVLHSLVKILGGKMGQSTLCEEAIDKLNELARELDDEGFKPSTDCYNALILALGAEGKMHKAEQIFAAMNQPSFLSNSNISGPSASLSTNLESHHCLLRALCASSLEKSSMRAVEFLRQWVASLRFYPSVTTFNLVFECLLKDKDPDLQRKVETARALIQRMEAGKASWDPKPDEQTYLSLIRLFAKASTPDEAFETLKRFCQLCENGAINSRPNVRHFNSVIRAFAEASSCGNDAFTKACEVFQMMSEGSYVFHRFSSFGEEELFSAEPDEETYVGLLKIAVLSSENVNYRMLRTEAVLEAMVQQRWHEKPYNRDAALDIFENVLVGWVNEDTEVLPNEIRQKMVHRIENLKKLIESIKGDSVVQRCPRGR